MMIIIVFYFLWVEDLTASEVVAAATGTAGEFA